MQQSLNRGFSRRDKTDMDVNHIGRIAFNTDALPERDRFGAFCEAMFRNIVGADIVRIGSAPFHGELELRGAGVVAIANIATTSAEIIRNVHHMRDGNDALVVQLWQKGRAVAFQGNHEYEVAERNGHVIDNGRPARVCADDVVRFWSLEIPRNIISSQIPNVDLLAGARLHDELPLRLLFGYLEGTLKQTLDNGLTARLFGSHLVDLVALTLGRENKGNDLEEAGGVRAARLAAILRLISRSATDPQLNATAAAARLGVTPRYVQMILEVTGRSFSEHVLEQRLERAFIVLRDPQQRGRKIAAIAFACGFGDLSYFNRVFRRRYGATPSDVRAAAPS
jgi:AraC-like DNA-binding protein